MEKAAKRIQELLAKQYEQASQEILEAERNADGTIDADNPGVERMLRLCGISKARAEEYHEVKNEK